MYRSAYRFVILNRTFVDDVTSNLRKSPQNRYNVLIAHNAQVIHSQRASKIRLLILKKINFNPYILHYDSIQNIPASNLRRQQITRVE